MIDRIHKNSPKKLSGSVHKHGAGGGRIKEDIDPKCHAHSPARMSDMTSAAIGSEECGRRKARVNKRYGYKQTVFGNEAGK